MGNGAGKSGSLFYFSSDNRFLIKTVNKDEKKAKTTKVVKPYPEIVPALGTKRHQDDELPRT